MDHIWELFVWISSRSCLIFFLGVVIHNFQGLKPLVFGVLGSNEAWNWDPGTKNATKNVKRLGCDWLGSGMYRLTIELLGFFQIAGLDFLLQQFTISNQLSVGFGCAAGSDRNDRGCKWVYFTYLRDVHKLLLGVKFTPEKNQKNKGVAHSKPMMVV